MNYKILALPILVLFLACANGERASQSPSMSLTIATSLPIGGLDPFSSRSGIGANIVELLYVPLFRLDSYSNIIPEFAKEVRWDDDSKTRLLVVLPDGGADDVKHSIEKASEESGGDLYEGMRNLNGIRIIDKNNIYFDLKKFDRAFLILLSQIPIVRFSASEKETGAFRVLAQEESKVSLVRKVPSKIKVNNIVFKVIPSSRRAMRELVAGNVDFIFFARESDFQVLTDVPDISVDQVSSKILFQILENRSKRRGTSALNWKGVEKALIGQNLLSEKKPSQFDLPQFPVPKSDPWYPVGWEGDVVNGIPPKSSEGKRSLSFLGEQSRDRRVARVLKRAFETIGVDLALIDLSPEEFNQEIFNKRNFDLALLPFNVKDTLISNILVFYTPQGSNSLNFSNYSNPKVDRFLDQARYSANDDEARQRFSMAMAELKKEPPGLFLFWLKIPIAMRDRCSGFRFDTNNEFFSSLKDVRCEPSAAN